MSDFTALTLMWVAIGFFVGLVLIGIIYTIALICLWLAERWLEGAPR